MHKWHRGLDFLKEWASGNTNKFLKTHTGLRIGRQSGQTQLSILKVSYLSICTLDLGIIFGHILVLHTIGLVFRTVSQTIKEVNAQS